MNENGHRKHMTTIYNYWRHLELKYKWKLLIIIKLIATTTVVIRIASIRIRSS